MKTKQEFEAEWPELMANVPCGFYCPTGWTDLVWNLLLDIDEVLEGGIANSEFKLSQVKEKFGGLRFYYSFPKSADHVSSDYIRQLVDQAEGESWGICLTCGTTEGVETKVAGGGNFGWVASQCEPCRLIPKHPRVIKENKD